MRKIFISYSHRDDQPFGPRDLRWVEMFEKALRETLGQRVGPGRVELWRDKRRLTGASLFDDEIDDQLSASDLLITVLSRHYLDSDYCRKELQRFGEQRLAHGGLHVSTMSRILKVYRAAIDRGDLRNFAESPELAREIDGSTGYIVYCTDDNGEDRDALLDPHGMELVWQKADDLAKTVKRVIDESPANGSAPAAAAAPDASQTVYLARTATDMREARECLRRELEDRGYAVLPGGDAAEDPTTYAQDLRRDLARSRLSVHLLGQRFGATLEGSSESGVSIQASLALEVQRPEFSTLFWSPPDGAGADPAMQALVARIADLPLEAGRAEYLRAPLDQLKAQMLDRLRTKTAPAPAQAQAAAAGAAGSRSIYLICDSADREATRPLKDALQAQGFEVTRPLQEGDPEELLADHKTCLVSCDVAAIVWGKSREAWVRAKLRDLQQAPGWGRKQPFLARLVILGPPDSPAKLDFDAPAGVTLLQAAEVPAALQPMLQ